MDLKCANIEGSSVPTECALRIQLQHNLGKTIIGNPTVNSACHVTQHLAGFRD